MLSHFVNFCPEVTKGKIHSTIIYSVAMLISLVSLGNLNTNFILTSDNRIMQMLKCFYYMLFLTALK